MFSRTAQGVHKVYERGVSNICARCAQGMHKVCTKYAQGMHDVCQGVHKVREL